MEISENKAKKMILNQSYTKDIEEYIKKAKNYSNEQDRQRFINNEQVVFFFRSTKGVDRFQVKLTQDMKTLRFLLETSSGFYDKYTFPVDELFPNKDTEAKKEVKEPASTTKVTTKKVVKETTSTTTKKAVKRTPRKKTTKTTQESK